MSSLKGLEINEKPPGLRFVDHSLIGFINADHGGESFAFETRLNGHPGPRRPKTLSYVKGLWPRLYAAFATSIELANRLAEQSTQLPSDDEVTGDRWWFLLSIPRGKHR